LKTAPPAAEAVAAPVSPSQPLPEAITEQSGKKAVVPKKLLWAGVGVAVVAVAFIGYIAFRPGKHEVPAPAKIATGSHPEPVPFKIEKPPGLPAPEIGKLSVETNLDQVDVLIDGVPKGVTSGKHVTLNLLAGRHVVSVEKPGFTTSAQVVTLAKDGAATLHFKLTPATQPDQPAREPYIYITSTPGA